MRMHELWQKVEAGEPELLRLACWTSTDVPLTAKAATPQQQVKQKPQHAAVGIYSMPTYNVNCLQVLQRIALQYMNSKLTSDGPVAVRGT